MLAIDREAIAGLSRRRRVRRLAIFGSAVTDRFDPRASDADFLVEFEGPRARTSTIISGCRRTWRRSWGDPSTS